MEVGHPVETAWRQVDMWAGVVGGDQSQHYKCGHHWLKLEFQALWLDEITWGVTRGQPDNVTGSNHAQVLAGHRLPGNWESWAAVRKSDFHQPVLCSRFPTLSLELRCGCASVCQCSRSSAYCVCGTLYSWMGVPAADTVILTDGCSGLNGDPQNIDLISTFWNLWCDLIEKKGFANVIKLKISRCDHSGLSGWLLDLMTCPYRGHRERGGEGGVKTEAETGVTQFIPVTEYTWR